MSKFNLINLQVSVETVQFNALVQLVTFLDDFSFETPFLVATY